MRLIKKAIKRVMLYFWLEACRLFLFHLISVSLGFGNRLRSLVIGGY